MTGIEHRQLKGITIKNMIVTIVCTASIVSSVLTTYFGLKSDIKDISSTQETTNRVNEIRLKLLESQVTLLQQQMHELTDYPKRDISSTQDRRSTGYVTETRDRNGHIRQHPYNNN